VDSVHKASTVVLFAVVIFCAANWSLIVTAWKYRREIGQAADVVGPLKDMGVIK
jgi:hypothetical protein